jgi:uncharacterized protein
MRRLRRASLEQKVAFLRDPRNHADHPTRVRVIETHFAWVFLTRRYAYKLKKPVRHASMDYRALAARARGSRDELRLNRRLAAGVYLSTVPLVSGNGALACGGPGRVEDWLVKMRRLADARMFDVALRRRTTRASDIDRVVSALVRFFARVPARPIGGARYVARLRRLVRGNHRVLRRVGVRIPQSSVEELARTQLALIAREFGAVAARGSHIADGHGDLRAEHVYLGPPVAVIDCLEFDRDLRRLDPAEEVALLALDIHRLGTARLARQLVRRYCVAARDPVSAAVWHLYMSHRAATRAKLAAWHLWDPQVAHARPWLARARSDLAAALRHARLGLRVSIKDGSRCGGQRPGLKQRRKRRSSHAARHRLSEQRRDRENREPAAG